MGEIDLGMVNWARAQFTLTAMYHWLFVPITLGLSFLCAFFETVITSYSIHYTKLYDHQQQNKT